jgi:hypothetical protein
MFQLKVVQIIVIRMVYVLTEGDVNVLKDIRVLIAHYEYVHLEQLGLILLMVKMLHMVLQNVPTEVNAVVIRVYAHVWMASQGQHVNA